jgi:hypothetical protein
MECLVRPGRAAKSPAAPVSSAARPADAVPHRDQYPLHGRKGAAIRAGRSGGLVINPLPRRDARRISRSSPRGSPFHGRDDVEDPNRAMMYLPRTVLPRDRATTLASRPRATRMPQDCHRRQRWENPASQ